MPLGDAMEERSIMLGLIVIILATVVILGAYFVEEPRRMKRLNCRSCVGGWLRKPRSGAVF